VLLCCDYIPFPRDVLPVKHATHTLLFSFPLRAKKLERPGLCFSLPLSGEGFTPRWGLVFVGGGLLLTFALPGTSYFLDYWGGVDWRRRRRSDWEEVGLFFSSLGLNDDKNDKGQ